MHHFRKIALAVFLLAVGGGLVTWEMLVRHAHLPEGLTALSPITPVLQDMRGREIGVLPNAVARECRPITLREAGRWLPWATVAIEDHRFWQHRGVDFHAMAGSAWRDLRNRRIISGASTITQQLIKIAGQRTGRTASAKVQELFAALKLERTWTKNQILESYLNRLDYGNRRIGAEAAARAYFNKSAQDLSLGEAIFLAGLPQSPARLNPWTHLNAATDRYRRNVQRLAAEGMLPPGTDEKDLLDHPPTVTHNDPPARASYFSALARVRTQELKVRTTLDLDLQKVVEGMLAEHLKTGSGAHDAAVVVIDNETGEIRALACAGDPRFSAINSAAEPRSCGSTLKPFLYLAGIERRMFTSATLLPDTAESISDTYRDYDPQNYSKRHFGPVRVREALASSLNVPAVVALGRLGARATFDGLKKWGLQFPAGFDAYGAGFILGNAPVRLIDLAGAYASLARGGVAWAPKFTARDAPEQSIAASPESCAIIADILCDNTARALSFGLASPLHFEARTAAKTGTSSGFRDGWCVGFNHTHTVAVWAGNLSGRSMGEVLAVRSAAPLWAAIMRHLYAAGDEPVPPPAASAGLHQVEVAAETGLRPRVGEKTVHEWFLAGTEPTEDAATCYDGNVWLLPPEYAGWCVSDQNRIGARVRSGPLTILFPRDGATFLTNASLPKGQQMLPFKSSAPRCEWFLNGKKLGEPMVPLEAGQWTIMARAGEETTEVHYSVE